MSEKNRTKWLLGALCLVGVFGVFGVWRQFGGSSDSAEPVARASRGGSRGQSASPAATDPREVIELEVAQLEHRPATYSPGRDLFQYAREAPKVERQAPAERPKPKPDRPRAARQRGPARPTPPSIDVKFLGSFGPTERRIAVFNNKNDILNAFEGDVVNKKFIVGPIGYESVEMLFVGFPDVPPKRLAAGG